MFDYLIKSFFKIFSFESSWAYCVQKKN